MDVSYIIDNRLAVGGGIWTAEDMAEMAAAGFTHIVNLQAEFDHTEMARMAGLQVLWNPTEDDLSPKPGAFFERAASFAVSALEDEKARVYVHCAAGVHRGPLAAAGVLCALGYRPEAAMELIAARRNWAEFPDVYRRSLKRWAMARDKGKKKPAKATRSAKPS
ncbi:MAG TPA: dual specificity protein phosphatase family protein [Terriglobales bacterium]|jgi:protein-tyrosine phosphatase